MAFGQPNPAFFADMSGFLSGMGAQQPMALQQSVAPPMAQAAQPPVAPIAQAVQAQQHHGINWLGVLADALSGAAGQPGMYAQSMMRQKEHQRELDDYSRRRMDENTDWRSHYQYEVDHPKPHDPVGYAAELAAMGLTPGTPEFNQRMSAHLNAVDDPLVTMTLPGDHVYSGPRSGLAAALGGAAPNLDTTPTVENGYRYIPGPGGRANQSNWTPLGGQSGASQAGGFPDPMNAPGRMTSGRRTVEGNRMVGGVTNSHHLTGDAADYVGASVSDLRKYFGPSVKIIPEGDHNHVQGIGPGRVPYFGKRGIFGLGNR